MRTHSAAFPDARRWMPFARRSLLVLTSALLAGHAIATNHVLRQDELMVGLNGDPAVQYIQITTSDGTQKAWGPGPGETTSRAMLVFFNGAGAETGRFLFPQNAPVGQNTVLIATTNFAALPGAPVPDFIMPPLLSSGSGKVCFRGNPANRNAFGVNLCLSYGNFPAAQTEGGGPPAPALPMTGEPFSLERTRNFGFGGTVNNDFALATPSPSNTRGQRLTITIPGPEIDFDPTNINFGGRNLNLGPTGSQLLIINNRGAQNSLTISNVSFVGADTNQFVLVSDSGQTNLLPTGARTIQVAFDPDSPGVKRAMFRIESDDENEPVSFIPVQGHGVDPNAPEIDVTPPSGEFELVEVGSGVAQPITVAIVNQGTISALNLRRIQLAGTDADQFQLVGATNAGTLAPTAQRTVAVVFNPTSAGRKSAVLRIESDDTDEAMLDVPLSGRAFDLNPCVAPNPANSIAQDLCSNAQLICPGAFVFQTTPGQVIDGSISCSDAGVSDFWFRYVPANNGTASVSVASGALFGPILSAHSGCPGTRTNELTCDFPATPGSPAHIAFLVTARTPVLVRVAGNFLGGASIGLTVTGPPCYNFDRNDNGVTDACELDFGDAPAPYPTRLADNGARHRAFTELFLGGRVDPEPDGFPSRAAVGDNQDGIFNDEDGVAFTSPLTVGQSASVAVEASASGRLQGWIDFNADGDWADTNEQVFINVPLSAGINALTFNVPANARIANLTYARFRFSSIGVGVTGASPDGEVEDYAVEILPATPTPGELGVRFREVMAGLNGDSSMQFIALEVDRAASKAWGPQAGETVGRAMLAFFDEAGRQTGRYVFPADAPAVGNVVLVATHAFAEQTGLIPDFFMPPELNANAGKVVFQSNPDNRRFNLAIALSYGGRDYFGTTDGAGPANENPLPILHPRSLRRVNNVPFGLNQNAAFVLTNAAPQNAAGRTVTLTPQPLAEQGRTLFNRETFRGNGRTCATCHREGRDQFGLTPLTIAALEQDDPLFVFEHGVHTLVLAGRSQPSDLRGVIRGATGVATVLGGSGDTFFVSGDTNLSGAITDAAGNRGTFRDLIPGDLDGPTPSNGSERGLEAHNFLEHGRGLILENIDGFTRREVFRQSPHLLQLEFTAPFGLSGNFNDLGDFSDNAVVQHFTRSLARQNGLDFRHPTRSELGVMTEFMLSIPGPATNQLDLDRFATTEAQKRGRALFFGDEGRCSKCHSGPVLALSDGTLPGSVKDRNENFDTGVANQALNIFDLLPTEPPGLELGHSTRAFNTPSLFNVRLTAPFFHDGSATNLADAVKFYDSTAFHDSPAFDQVGSILAANKAELTADLVAFLESLVELPVTFTRELQFGVHCPGQPRAGAMVATITNTSAHTIRITNVVINGANARDFAITSDSGQTTLAPRASRRFQVAFNPATLGVKQATLEVAAVDTNLLGAFSFGIALRGADVDNVVRFAPGSLNFGTRDIDAPPSPEESIEIVNDGSTDLPITVELIGDSSEDFVLTTETNAIPAHGTRVMQVAFAPRRTFSRRGQGEKTALLRIRMVSCSGSLIEIPLAGMATATVTHFRWDPVGATQFVGTPFPMRVLALDRNNDIVTSFRGVVRLTGVTAAGSNLIPVTPTNSTPFVSGVWTGAVTVLAPHVAMSLQARDNRGHIGNSSEFLAALRDDLALTVTDSPNPNVDGRPVTYTLRVHNTGPQHAVAVLVTNQLSPGVSFVSASTSQGAVSHADGIVFADLGRLPAAATASVSIVVALLPGFAVITNVARVSRAEPELVLANNVATNITQVAPFGALVVSPATDFNAVGPVGGPFTPTNQIYTLSNAGTAALTWQVRGGSRCTGPEGIVGLWPLDGDTTDRVGTNSGSILGGAVFRPGFIAQALGFDGIDDHVEIPASPTLDIGAGPGFTLELWINPADLQPQQPLLEWQAQPGGLGVHFWISQTGPGPGSLFANVIDANNTAHHIASAGGLLRTGVWQHVALTYDRASGMGKLFLNGAVVTELAMGSFTPLTGPPLDLSFGRRTGSQFLYLGAMDDVGIYKRALSPAEIASIANAGSAGKCPAGSGRGGRDCNLPEGAVAWWPFDGATDDRVGTNAGTRIGGTAFTNGFVGQALFFDGTSGGVRVPVSPALDLGTNDGFTFETWFNVPDAGRRGPLFAYDDGSPVSGPLFYLGTGGSGSFHLNLVNTGNGANVFNTPPGLFSGNTWHHTALSYSRTSGISILYVDGQEVFRQNFGSFQMRTTGTLVLGRRTTVGAQESLLGSLDEPTFYNRELSSNEVRAIFMFGARGKCSDTSWFSFSPASGTLPPGSSTNVSLALNTNAFLLAAGSYSDVAAFTNASSAPGSTTRSLTLVVVQSAPRLDPLPPLRIGEDSTVVTVNLTGISAGAGSPSILVTAFSGNSDLVPNPITVNYVSPAATGTLRFAPRPNANGTAVVSVVVTTHGGLIALTNQFGVTVTPVNDPPSLAPIPDQIVREGSPFLLTTDVSDPDLPGDRLTFSLVNPPAGAVIDPATGAISWTPSEAQGPGTSVMNVIVRDSGTPTLSATNRFAVTVLEVNSPPALVPLPDRVVHEGALVAWTAQAIDPDIPVNRLSFSLGPGAPPGASINASSGQFRWLATGVAVPSTNTVIVFVNDDGVPLRTDGKSCVVVVTGAPRILGIARFANGVVLSWTAIPNARYRVQFKDQLSQRDWTDLPGEVMANGFTTSKGDALGARQRFYRILVVE